MQLDHMVSQKTLREFVDTYKLLDGLTSDPRSRWEVTRTALATMRGKFVGLREGEQEAMSEGHLVNIPGNIVPGLANQVQGAGDEFDPQVAEASNADGVSTFAQTELSRSQFAMDAAIRKLNQVVGSAGSVLPKGTAARGAHIYDQEVDELIAAELDRVTTALTYLESADVPAYDADAWYTFQGSRVKKRPADWIEDESTVTIGGTVEAVNTFWKTDPHTYLTGADGTELLETELRLALERSFNFSKTPDNVEPGEEEQDDWSKTADKLFFQGHVESLVAAKSGAGIDYDVTVDLKSIAPQDPALAHALLPGQLG